MAYFPFYIDIENKKCLIAGGGEVAYRKAEAVLLFGANVTVTAPKICEELTMLSSENQKLLLVQREFCEKDLEDIFFVIAATDDRKVNDRIFELCTKKQILVNVVDEKDQCSFFFPSFVKRRDFVIGISSGGKSPALSKFIRKKLEELIPDYVGEINDRLGEMRGEVKEEFNSIEEKRAFYENIIKTFLKRF